MEFVETILVAVAVIASIVRIAMIRPYSRAAAAEE
jgi:hypothetical protein